MSEYDDAGRLQHGLDDPYDDFDPYAEEDEGEPEHGEDTEDDDGVEFQDLSEAPIEAAPPQLTGSREDALILNLTIRAGELNLPLGQLAQLGPGVILQAEGGVAGEAALYYREQKIARGLLVDVEGRLGLQIQEMLLT